MLQPTQESVVYAAQTKLLDLAYETAQTRNLNKVLTELYQGAQIYYWLQSLDRGEDYLTYTEREKIWRCLIEIAEIYDFPTAPTLVNRPVDINAGGGGGNTIINNITYNFGSTFGTTEIDTTTITADSIPVTDDYGAVWYYTVRKGVNQRSGIVQASWLSDGSSVSYSEESVGEIGDTSPITISVDFSGGNIRLRVAASNNDWFVSGTRILING